MIGLISLGNNLVGGLETKTSPVRNGFQRAEVIVIGELRAISAIQEPLGYGLGEMSVTRVLKGSLKTREPLFFYHTTPRFPGHSFGVWGFQWDAEKKLFHYLQSRCPSWPQELLDLQNQLAPQRLTPDDLNLLTAHLPKYVERPLDQSIRAVVSVTPPQAKPGEMVTLRSEIRRLEGTRASIRGYLSVSADRPFGDPPQSQMYGPCFFNMKTPFPLEGVFNEQGRASFQEVWRVPLDLPPGNYTVSGEPDRNAAAPFVVLPRPAAAELAPPLASPSFSKTERGNFSLELRLSQTVAFPGDGLLVETTVTSLAEIESDGDPRLQYFEALNSHGLLVGWPMPLTLSPQTLNIHHRCPKGEKHTFHRRLTVPSNLPAGTYALRGHDWQAGDTAPVSLTIRKY